MSLNLGLNIIGLYATCPANVSQKSNYCLHCTRPYCENQACDRFFYIFAEIFKLKLKALTAPFQVDEKTIDFISTDSESYSKLTLSFAMS